IVDDEDAPVVDRVLQDCWENGQTICVVRAVVQHHNGLDREGLIKAISVVLGHERVGSRIRAAIDNALRTAARRNVVYSEAGGIFIYARNMSDYDPKVLLEQLPKAIGTAWIKRQD